MHIEHVLCCSPGRRSHFTLLSWQGAQLLRGFALAALPDCGSLLALLPLLGPIPKSSGDVDSSKSVGELSSASIVGIAMLSMSQIVELDKRRQMLVGATRQQCGAEILHLVAKGIFGQIDMRQAIACRWLQLKLQGAIAHPYFP